MKRFGSADLCKHCYQEWYKSTDKFKSVVKASRLRNRARSAYLARKNQERPEKRYAMSISTAKSRQKKWDIPFEHYKDLISRPCYYCQGKLNPTSIGLDRINNSKGYEVDNVLPCCLICNKTRNNMWTVQETQIMINAVQQYRKSLITVTEQEEING